MIILKPFSMETVWGTSRLHNYSGDSSIKKIGCVYTATGIPGLSNVILNGDFEGMTLDEAVSSNPSFFGLREGEEYPVIIAFTGNSDNCSIQTHPTDEVAQKMGLKYGKEESWYFIEEPLEGSIYAEALIDDKDRIMKYSKEGIVNLFVNRKKVQQGEVVHILPGTVHALTTGSLVYEIQQSTNITYRFYDFERVDNEGNQRQLQLEEALETLDTRKKINVSKLPKDVDHTTRSYTIKHVHLSNSYTNTAEIAQAVSVMENKLIVNNEEIAQGQSILVLPNETITVQKGTSVMIATPKRYW